MRRGITRNRLLVSIIASAVLLAGVTVPAAPASAGLTGCFPSTPNVGVSTDQTRAWAFVDVECKELGVVVADATLGAEAKGEDCTQPVVDLTGGGSTLVELEAEFQCQPSDTVDATLEPAVDLTAAGLPLGSAESTLTLHNDSGADPTAVEYAVMLALIVVVCITAVTSLGANNQANSEVYASIET